MEITEYDRLVSSETESLQSKMTAAIDESMYLIQTKQTELMDSIKSDPRRSAIKKKNIKLVLQISNEQEDDKNEIRMLKTPSTSGLPRTIPRKDQLIEKNNFFLNKLKNQFRLVAVH